MSPLATVPIGIIALVLLGWYWWSMGLPDVPASRRRIRRVSLLFAAASVVTITIAMSFVDPAIQPSAYILAWSVALLLLVAVLVTAAIDMVNNFRLQEHARHDRVIEAAAEAARIRQAREQQSPIDAAHTTGEANAAEPER